MDMLTIRLDSAIRFLSALKEQDRPARTQGPPVRVKLGNPVPESPELQRDCPAYTVGIPKQAAKPSKQAGLSAKKQLVRPPKKRFESSALDRYSDSDIHSDPYKSDKSSASEDTSDLPDLAIPIKLKGAAWRAFPAVAAPEFTSPRVGGSGPCKETELAARLEHVFDARSPRI